VTLLPRSLFGRLSLLLVTVVALTVVTSFVLIRQDRTNLINRQLSETKLAQLQAIRTALEGVDGPQRRESLAQLNREYGVRIVPESERTPQGPQRGGPLMQELAERLRERLGPESQIRFAPRAQMLLVRIVAADTPYWSAFPCRRDRRRTSSRPARWSGRWWYWPACLPLPTSLPAISRSPCAT